MREKDSREDCETSMPRNWTSERERRVEEVMMEWMVDGREGEMERTRVLSVSDVPVWVQLITESSSFPHSNVVNI